jgi:hypothetical protein
MMARLLAEMKTNQAKMDTSLKEMRAGQGGNQTRKDGSQYIHQ